MHSTSNIKKRLDQVFEERQATVLVEVIEDAYSELVKTSDFNELKGIVADIARSQKELAEAQKRTEVRVEELAEAQKMTENELRELAYEVKGLASGLKDTREDVGGISRTMSYAFENEAYRNLPKVLEEGYGIVVKDKVIRAEIGKKEINVFAGAEKEGREILIVGEAKLKLDEKIERLKRRRGQEDVFEELGKKVDVVKEEYGELDIVRVLVCHFATKGFIKEAEAKGVIVVQSFEW